MSEREKEILDKLAEKLPTCLNANVVIWKERSTQRRQ